MKKIYIFTALFFFFSTLLPFFNVYADDIVYDENNIITVTPSATSEEITKGNGIGLITELLRQGGSIDFTNTTGTFANFFDSMIESFDSVLTSTFGTSSGLQDIWINPFDFSFNSLTTYINPTEKDPRLKNALKNYRLNVKYEENETETPTPDINYISYINDINNTNFYWKNASNPNPSYPYLYLISPMENMSFFRLIPSDDLNNSGISSGLASSITSIYIFSDGNNYSYSCKPSEVPCFNNSSYSEQYTNSWGRYADNYPNGGILTTNNDHVVGTPTFTYTGSLENVFKHIRANFVNVNIYVNGTPWAIVNQAPTIPIGTNTIVSPYNLPVEYNYNQPVYIIPEDIWNRLELLFNQKVNVTFEDIKDLIIDVNGQTALAVYEISIENLDLMYNEKYESYTSIPYFNKEKIAEMITLIPYSFIDDGIVVVATAVSPIPTDIIIIFGILFVFVLFACIINRLLE